MAWIIHYSSSLFPIKKRGNEIHKHQSDTIHLYMLQ